MYPFYNSFKVAIFGIALNANLAGYTAAVPNQFVSHSLVSSVQVSSVSKTLASGSVSKGLRLIASAGGTSGVLRSGQALAPNQSLTSPSGQYSLVCQSDGNLVLYDNSTSSAYWASLTTGRSVNQCIMQSDGNLVVYGGSGSVWNSSTFGHSGAYLAVQNDRNVVIYAANGQALWATNTSVTDERVIQYANNYNYYGTVSSINFKNDITNIVKQGGSIQNIAFTPQGGFVIIYTTQSSSYPLKYNFYYQDIPQEAINELNSLISPQLGTSGAITDIEFAPQGGFVILYDELQPPYISSDTPQALANEIRTLYNQNRLTRITQVLFPPQGGFVFVANTFSDFIFSNDIPQALRTQFQAITNTKASLQSIAFTPQGGFVANIGDINMPHIYYGNIPQALVTQINQIPLNFHIHVIAFSPSNEWVLIAN